MSVFQTASLIVSGKQNCFLLWSLVVNLYNPLIRRGVTIWNIEVRSKVIL